MLIATTNAIIAGLIACEALKLYSNKNKECRHVFITIVSIESTLVLGTLLVLLEESVINQYIISVQVDIRY